MTKPDFQKKIGSNLGKLGPNLAKFEVFGFKYYFRAKFGPNLDLSPNCFCFCFFSGSSRRLKLARKFDFQLMSGH